MIYIGAELMITPLGDTTEQNWSGLMENRSGISLVAGAGFSGESIHLAKMHSLSVENRFEKLVTDSLTAISHKIDPAILSSDRTLVLISSTKGALDVNVKDQFASVMEAMRVRFSLVNVPVVVSNACISGVLAINAASNFIKSNLYDHAVVIGCDVLSDFVINGFQSLFAASDQPCAPFDVARNGITLGEGCSAVVLSRSSTIFYEAPLELLTGASANDANHISGPSRTGEGLYRSVKKTLANNQVQPGDIDFISAHGTATVFNDEMESIAFDRLDMSNVPLNSFKGYFGHTLGAAGVIETAASMQMIRNGALIKSLGFRNAGTSKPLHVVLENEKKELRTILKTASGFGGGNASLIIRKI
ncbi:beta-ketoacyl synthase N-terminal-like domain-containing protein [Dyadobacter sp. Leaf189]|uniref:beta-ketoacyl synthase N-terminal-like domain-containing protein n=1 Tax=Dyadobacter sp. Leaf189 TaxID=1736295 RepID=UPI0007012992|nr:beta-ketoacyl synthase N-terminal-like domain-containing protein [Dyadobacter sp. Leaf189]KQS27731.1 beta-ketoacyl synthase [Dyadobacter sp. Leaf189]